MVTDQTEIELLFDYTTNNITFEKGRIFKVVSENLNCYTTNIVVKDYFEYYGNTWYTGGKGPHPKWKIGINWYYKNIFIPKNYAKARKES